MSILTMGQSRCQNLRPKWTAKFYAGTPDIDGISRSQDNDIIYCKDPTFNDYVCLSYDDLKKLETEVLSKCKDWSGIK